MHYRKALRAVKRQFPKIKKDESVGGYFQLNLCDPSPARGGGRLGVEAVLPPISLIMSSMSSRAVLICEQFQLVKRSIVREYLWEIYI